VLFSIHFENSVVGAHVVAMRSAREENCIFLPECPSPGWGTARGSSEKALDGEAMARVHAACGLQGRGLVLRAAHWQPSSALPADHFSHEIFSQLAELSERNVGAGNATPHVIESEVPLMCIPRQRDVGIGNFGDRRMLALATVE
jgi:hypothetical protein